MPLDSTNLVKDIGIVIAIILVDLALSGDNALVIGAVASKLGGLQRRRAITFGGMIAIVLRVALTFLAVFLLQIPYVSLFGGVLVFYIAVGLIRDIETEQEEVKEIAEMEAESKQKPLFRRPLSSDTTFVRAITTIAIADLSMSLDNALAIAALARKELVLLAIGLFFSVALLLIASAGIAALIARFPLLMYLAGVILALTAGSMILGDPRVAPIINQWDAQVPGPPLYYMLLAAFGIIFILIAWLLRPKHPSANMAHH
jgi:YjbE family integral membrane protein